MKTAFKLDAHPRRPRPLSEPPVGYFDQLPTRVMARLPRAAAPEPLAGRWRGFLAPAWRTGFAAVAVLGGFAAAFYPGYTGGPAPLVPAPASTAALDAVPRTELVGYLLTSGTRIETADLAALTAAHPGVANGFLQVSAAEVNDALDAQPFEDATYL